MITSNAGSFKEKYLTLVLSIILFLAAISIHSQLKKPDIKVNKQDTAYTLNSTFLKMIAMGNKRVISNVLWIQTLLESDLERYNRKDFADWMYLRFLTISTLDPLFYENYLYGGMYLSVVKDDLLGAAEIFEKGLEHYPEDYQLLYYTGFNYYYELGDFENGFRVLKKLADHAKTPQIMKQVINKLQFEVTGDYELALTLLNENLRLAKDEAVREKILADIFSVTSDRDLACLNAGRNDCSRKDIRGLPYVLTKDGWRSQVIYKPYKIYRREDQINRKNP